MNIFYAKCSANLWSPVSEILGFFYLRFMRNGWATFVLLSSFLLNSLGFFISYSLLTAVFLVSNYTVLNMMWLKDKKKQQFNMNMICLKIYFHTCFRETEVVIINYLSFDKIQIMHWFIHCIFHNISLRRYF